MTNVLIVFLDKMSSSGGTREGQEKGKPGALLPYHFNFAEESGGGVLTGIYRWFLSCVLFNCAHAGGTEFVVRVGFQRW
jgi:hypothetical protein